MSVCACRGNESTIGNSRGPHHEPWCHLYASGLAGSVNNEVGGTQYQPFKPDLSAFADCDCADWKENMPKVNAPIMLQVARGSMRGYEGKVFRYCPWCGKKRAEPLTVKQES